MPHYDSSPPFKVELLRDITDEARLRLVITLRRSTSQANTERLVETTAVDRDEAES